ncbi:hypothetical protein Gasu2_61500 [Galdieria sulphuraria]|nr:hypothetical protein Gasu2_61500 [Galdieria sulphuraria]
MHSIVGLVGVCSAIAVRTSLARQPLSRSEQLSLKLPDNLKVQFKRQHIRSDTKLTSSCKVSLVIQMHILKRQFFIDFCHKWY